MYIQPVTIVVLLFYSVVYFLLTVYVAQKTKILGVKCQRHGANVGKQIDRDKDRVAHSPSGLFHV